MAVLARSSSLDQILCSNDQFARVCPSGVVPLKDVLEVVRDYGRYRDLHQPMAIESKAIATSDAKDANATLGTSGKLMVWSAAAMPLGNSPPGSEFVSLPATPPVALLGERRAAPPGTRLKRGLLPSSRHQQGDVSMELHAIGIDLGKTLFHLVGVDVGGNVVVRKRCSRTQLLKYTANLRVQRIGMEACSGSHFLGRALREQGHDARLMPAQYVKPYVKTNKNDYIDAEAVAEAVQRPTMRFVPIKTEEQLDLQAVHRVRERWVMRRTAVINQIRGLLIERGVTYPKGAVILSRRFRTFSRMP